MLQQPTMRGLHTAWLTTLTIGSVLRWTLALVPPWHPRRQQVIRLRHPPYSASNARFSTDTLASRRLLVSLDGTEDQISAQKVVRYRCRVAYDGSGFSGFQLQQRAGGGVGSDEPISTKRTIQGVVEQVLQQRFSRVIRVVGAGRTDAGVHARGQAVHFDLTTSEHGKNYHDLELFETAMNRMLPPDIRVWNVEPAPAPSEELVNNGTAVYAWNVMRKSSAKLYSYRLCLADSMDPLLRHDRWQLDSNWVQTNSRAMNPEVLAEILRRYEGTHDFVCFAGALEANARKTGVKMTTVRTVHRCELVCEEEERNLYRIDIYLDGALYKMVRNLVGTAIDVWRNAYSTESFATLLDVPSNHGLTREDNPCKPAPPHGLTLERVFYADDDF